MATWIAVSYAALVVLLGTVGWFTSKRGVPDGFIMAQAVVTLPLSYVVSRTRLSGWRWMIAMDAAGFVQAAVLWVVLENVRA